MLSTNRLRAVLGICTLLSVPNLSSAQVLDQDVLSSTVWISYEAAPPAADTGKSKAQPKGSPAAKSAQPTFFGGTGFLLFAGIGFSKGRVFLVTNKHILPPEGRQQDIKVRVAVRNPDGSARVDEVSVPIVGPDGKYLASVRVHPDPETDVAAVNIAFAAFRAKFQLLIDAMLSRQYLDPSALMTSDKIRSSGVGMGSPVYIVGFPDALFDPRNISPVLRAGTIATDPLEGFNFNQELRRTIAFPEHVNGFLVDANIYPGSSGSLVLLAPDCAARNGGQEAKNANSRPAILGIVAGSIPILDSSLHSYSRIGLGIVYSADAIREVLQAFDRAP